MTHRLDPVADDAFRAPSLFITGTDTEIGKTLSSAALIHAFVTRGARVAAMKPVATGAFLRDDILCSEDLDFLNLSANVLPGQRLASPYLFETPASPNIVAAEAGRTIELEVIVNAYRRVAEQADAVVVEGIGGFLVPFGQDTGVEDLAKALELPVILVVGLRLGCISHALLSAEAITRRGLRLAGWIANAVDPMMRLGQENIDTIAARLTRDHGAPLLGVIPHLAEPSAAEASHHLDIDLLDVCASPS